MSFIPQDEIKRKMFHLLMILYIVAYYYLPERTVLIILGTFTVFCAIIEIVRYYNDKFNFFLLRTFSGIYRKSEEYKVAGILWTLIGAIITIVLFENRSCVLASFLFLALGDSAAALFGKAIGRHKIYAGKTLEGSLACFVVCVVVGFIIFQSWQIALIGALIATFIESIPWPLSDNLWMQVANAGVLTALTKYLPI